MFIKYYYCFIILHLFLPISLPLPLPLGVRCPPRPGLAATRLRLIPSESTSLAKSEHKRDIMNLRRGGRAGGGFSRCPPSRAYVDNYYPFCARLFWLSCAFICDHRKRGGGKPRSGGAAHPQGQGQGQGYGQK